MESVRLHERNITDFALRRRRTVHQRDLREDVESKTSSLGQLPRQEPIV